MLGPRAVSCRSHVHPSKPSRVCWKPLISNAHTQTLTGEKRLSTIGRSPTPQYEKDTRMHKIQRTHIRLMSGIKHIAGRKFAVLRPPERTRATVCVCVCSCAAFSFGGTKYAAAAATAPHALPLLMFWPHCWCGSKCALLLRSYCWRRPVAKGWG